MFRKYFVPAMLAGAVLLAVSCDPASEPSLSVTILSPTVNQAVPRGIAPVRVWCQANKCTVDSLVLRADGQRVDAVASPPETCNLTWDASAEDLGSRHVLTAVACYRYAAGTGFLQARESASVDVRVDTGGPDVAFVSPQDGDTVNQGGVPVTVWAKDPGVSGMDRVEFLIDEVLKGTDSAGTADTWRYTWDASQVSAGSHAIKAIAYNDHGEVAVEVIGITVRDTSSGGGPTYHHGYVDTSETWARAGNPHIVDGDVVFRSGARLTIEPGCIVKFDDFTLGIGTIDSSGLAAVGTASAPILFTSNQPVPAPGDWTGIRFGAYVLPGTRLGYCTIEYAGPHASECAAITMGGGGRVEEISDCTIRNGGMYGVFCREYAGFGTFRDNVVTANQGYALRVDAGLVEVLDAGNTLTGNDSAGVELYGRVSVSTTWPDLGVPYVIQDVSVGDSTNNPVLTIQPGAELRFKDIGALRVGKTGANLPARIVADGSAGRIKFTSPAPAPGGFYGVNVYGNLIGESEFRNCDFSYGGQGGSGLLSVIRCSPAITGCDFGYSAGWGIVFQTAQVPDTVALKQVNTFHDNVLGNIKWMLPFLRE